VDLLGVFNNSLLIAGFAFAHT